jgi:hypothetical protein
MSIILSRLECSKNFVILIFIKILTKLFCMTTSAYLNYMMCIEAERDKLSNHLIAYKLGALLETICLGIFNSVSFASNNLFHIFETLK